MPAVLVPVEQGKPIVLDKPIVLVGRHADCDFVILHSRKISRKHCAVALVNNRFVVRDLGSMNGVWVNGERVEHSLPLDFGDELMIGDVLYRLQADKAAASPKVAKPVPANGVAMTPPTPAKQPRVAEAIPAKKRPIVKAPQGADLSLEFPVPIEDSDDDGFDVPAPEAAEFDDSQADEFIPMKDA